MKTEIDTEMEFSPEIEPKIETKLEKIEKHFRILLIIYIVILIWAIFLKMNSLQNIQSSINYGIKNHHSLNFENPFSHNKFTPYYFNWKTSVGRTNILNILAFIPFGFLVSAVAKSYPFLKALLWSFFLSLAFEGTQFVTAIGGLEGMDLVLNTLGGLIGFLIFWVFNFIREQISVNAQEKLTAGVITICYLLFFPLAIYGVGKTFYHIDFYLSLIEPIIHSWQ